MVQRARRRAAFGTSLCWRCGALRVGSSRLLPALRRSGRSSPCWGKNPAWSGCCVVQMAALGGWVQADRSLVAGTEWVGVVLRGLCLGGLHGVAE